MRFFGVQCPSWSVTKNVPSGFRHTPLAARKPVARMSVREPSVLTLAAACRDAARRRASAWRARLGVVEVAGRVGLQAHRELVEVLGHLVVVVEALVEVGLAVAIQIVQDARSDRGR